MQTGLATSTHPHTTLVPSVQGGSRVVSVATSQWLCLALSRKSEVYSWGDGNCGSLGYADDGERAVPSRIESLSRVASIAAGVYRTNATVNGDSKLFTWGLATSISIYVL